MCGISFLLRKIRRRVSKKNKNQSKVINTTISKTGVNQGLKGSKVKSDVKTNATKVKKIEIREEVRNDRKGIPKVIDKTKSELIPKDSEIDKKEIDQQLVTAESETNLGKHKKKSIELVGNHLKNVVNKTNDSTAKAKTEHSESKYETSSKIKVSEKSCLNAEKQKQILLEANDSNSTSNTIFELNISEGLKPTEQQIKSTENGRNSELRSEHSVCVKKSSKCQIEINESFAIEQTSNSMAEKDMNVSSDEKPIHPFIRDDNPKASPGAYHFGTNKTSLKNKSTNCVSNIIPVNSIDLKTAKCEICLILVKYKINITGCSHVFCGDCLHEWLKYSQHCPVCRTLISRFAHSITIGSNGQICLRSQNDYKVSKVYSNEEQFVESFGAAFLFEAFCLNFQSLKYLDFSIENVSAKVSYLESILLFSGDVHKDIVIQSQLNNQNQKLKELREKKMQSEEGLKDISHEMNREMLAFWRRVVHKRELQ